MQEISKMRNSATQNQTANNNGLRTLDSEDIE